MYSTTESELSFTESELSFTESELSFTESESSFTESESSFTESESSFTESELSVIESESSFTESELSVTESELSVTESGLPVNESELPLGGIRHHVSIQQTTDDLPPELREQPPEDTVWHSRILSSSTFRLFQRTFEMLPSVKVVGQIPGKELYEVEMSELCFTFFETECDVFD